jgi:hypothetical protein
MDIYDIVFCTYKQNYMKCPPWNPHKLAECTQTMNYVERCMDDYNYGETGDTGDTGN